MMNIKPQKPLLYALIWLLSPWTFADSTPVRPAVDAAVPASQFPDLPEAIASFGAAVGGDWLYIFGGHVGGTHKHSQANLSHRFSRLNLTSPSGGWEDLGPVAGLQGLPLVAHGGRVCRIGGLTAGNATADMPEDLHSQDEVACYDPTAGTWSRLPPLPQPRSSHDAVVHEGHLYVVGGWQLRGQDQDSIWQETLAVLDLEAEGATWRTLPQPFHRRALAVAAAQGKIFALGGIGPEGTSRRVDVFDIGSETWSEAQELPAQAGRLKGFGVSAFGLDGHIYLSGADGRIHRLPPSGHWEEEVGRLNTPRFFHRLLPHRDRLLFIGGAHTEGHLASLESLSLQTLQTARNNPLGSPQALEARRWPGFRGDGSGHAPSDEIPLHWSDDENVAWKAELPGHGQSAPVVWNHQVFVTSVEGPHSETLLLSAFDLEDGTVRWRRRFPASQNIEASDMVSRGAPTPVLDQDRMYAFWESGDLLALDHEGAVLWRRSLTDEFGNFEGNHGVASSPVLADDAVVVQITHEGPSYFLAVHRSTGETLWKVDRPSAVAWTTPVVAAGNGRTEILSSAAGRVEALHAGTGEQLWLLEGFEKNHVPSATLAGDRLIVASSSPDHNLALLLQPTDGAERILWRAEGVTSGFGSPIVHGSCALFINKAGVVTCIDLENGGERWKHRLGESCWASPLAAGEHLFFFTKKGKTVVLRHDEEGPTTVAENLLSTDGTVYGVAAVHGAFLIRTGGTLTRVGVSDSGPGRNQSFE